MTEVPGETDAPCSDINYHRQQLQKCVADMEDILTSYVEEDVLTPGEFAKCFRDALQRMSAYHKSRTQLLDDCETLLFTRNDG